MQGTASDEVLEALGLPTGHDYMSFVEADWQGRPVIVCRTGYTGERGYELVPRVGRRRRPLWDALLEAAAPFDGLPCGLGARDTLRTEMGYPLHGHDLSLDDHARCRPGPAGPSAGRRTRFWGKDALVAEKAAGARAARPGACSRPVAASRARTARSRRDGEVGRRGHLGHVLARP